LSAPDAACQAQSRCARVTISKCTCASASCEAPVPHALDRLVSGWSWIVLLCAAGNGASGSLDRLSHSRYVSVAGQPLERPIGCESPMPLHGMVDLTLTKPLSPPQRARPLHGREPKGSPYGTTTRKFGSSFLNGAGAVWTALPHSVRAGPLGGAQRLGEPGLNVDSAVYRSVKVVDVMSFRLGSTPRVWRWQISGREHLRHLVVGLYSGEQPIPAGRRIGTSTNRRRSCFPAVQNCRSSHG